MRSLRNKRALGIAFGSLVAASVIVACANDFDTFEPGGGSSTPDAAPGADGAKVDGTTPPPGNDGSVGPTDGSTAKDSAPPTDCTTKASCGTTQTTCSSACDQTRATCFSGCPSGGQGQKCRSDCSDARDNCVQACHSTCRSCAGQACSGSVCP